MHVMIDLETLGTRPDAAIVQIGAVAFQAQSGGRVHNDKAFNRLVAYQDGAGSVDHGTLAWWLQQDGAKALGKQLESAVVLGQALEDLLLWPQQSGLDFTWENVEGVWAKPITFDLPILASAYARFGRGTPWHYRAARDVRTLFSLSGEPEMDWSGFKPHDALDDAIGQAMQVQKAFALLGR